eukprot:9414801-Alexandrium_andersonii.AAC.1
MATAPTAARRPDDFAGRACSSGLDLVVDDAARPLVFVGPGPVLSLGAGVAAGRGTPAPSATPAPPAAPTPPASASS